MSDLSIKLEGFPEKVQRIADVLEEAFPGRMTWVQSQDVTIKVEGYKVPVMPMRASRCKLSKYPGETAPSPAFIAAQPAFAGASGGSFLPDPALLSRAPARSQKSVSVTFGIRQVTVTPVSFSSLRRAKLNCQRKPSRRCRLPGRPRAGGRRASP